MATEVLDIVVRQRGARVVARDIERIGIAATSASRSVSALQRSLSTAQGSLQRVNATTRAATTSMRGFGGAAVGAKRSLTALGTGVALVGGALTLLFIRPLQFAIRAAGDFQEAMNLTAVLLNIDRTAEAFTELSNRAKELGITTVFSATQAAEGMQFLAKAGFEANEVLAAIGPTTDLAAAANLDLGRAADIATNILRGFRLTVGEFPAAVDILASAFTRSNATIEDFANSFKEAGPVAVEFNQRFSDVAAVLASLADAGIKTSKAGFALRRILVNIEKDATKLAPVLNEAGISIREVGEDGVEVLRPLNEIFVDIAKSSLTTADKIQLFGVRALAASGVITNSAEELEKFAKILEADFGRAAAVGGARLLGFKGAVRELNSALEGLGIAIAEAGLLDFLEFLTDKVKIAVRAFADLPKPIRAFIGFATAAAAIAALLTLKIGLLIIALAILKGTNGAAGAAEAIKGLGTALKATSLFFLTNPIGLFITALGVLGVALFLARDDVIEFGESQFTVGDIVSETADGIVASFGRAQKAAEDFKNAGKEAVEALEEAEKKSVFGDFFILQLFQIQLGFGVLVRIASAAFEAIKDQFRSPILFKIGDESQAAKDARAVAEAGGDSIIDNFARRIVAQGGFGQILLEEFDQGVQNILAADKDLQDRLTKSQKEREDAAKRAAELIGGGADDRETVGTGISKGEFERRIRQFGILTASLEDLTQTQQTLLKATITLDNAIEVNAQTADGAAAIFERLGEKVFAELERSLDPVNAALFEQARAMKDLELAADAGAISVERLARAQELLAVKSREALLKLVDFQKGLSTSEALTEGLRSGFEKFTDSLGNLFASVRDVVSDTLGGLLDEVNKFVTTGEADFRGFALNVIASIQKIILQMIVLQGIRAFETTIKEGKGFAEFAKALFGPRLKEPGVRDTTLQQPGRVVGGGFEVAGPAFGTAEATRAQELERRRFIQTAPGADLGKSPADPVHSSLTPDSPGVVAIRDGIGMKVDQSKVATVEQLTQILASIRVQNEAMRAAGVTGSSGTAAVTSSLETVTETTDRGLVENKNEVAKQGGIVDKTTQQGFQNNIATAVTVGGNIVRALASGTQADQLGAIGSIIGAVVGSFTPIGPAGGAAIGGQLGGLAGALQEGGVLRGNQVGQPFLVGERGPELFVPPTTGMVIPSDMLGALGGQPIINLQVVNVDDPQAIPEAITTREGEKAILNVLTRNRGKLKEILA